ncbi:MAG: hypothetical protein KID02_14370 [Clostridiales bacterium]|nr:hypothetical protein [Clostridiales bacterium]
MFKKNRILIAILTLGMLMVFVACSSSKQTSSSERPMEAVAEEAKQETSIVVDEVADQAGGIQFNTSSQLNRKVIKTGRIDLQTKTFDDTVQNILWTK